MIRGGAIERIYLRREYTSLLASVGAVPLILNADMQLEDTLALCDGIVISGGEDIPPELYAAERIPEVVRVEPIERFEWETGLIEACDREKVPILGICYGMQRLNVHYGGTLIQDIDSYLPENVGHWRTMHDITFTHDFLSMRETGVHEINARHHQAIGRLAEGFNVCATAPDGIIEAIEGHGHYGMQWHPESDSTGAHVYRSFAEECLRRKNSIDPVQL
jgi:putative glutamine amidotransferase